MNVVKHLPLNFNHGGAEALKCRDTSQMRLPAVVFTFTMKVQCAWCKADMGTKACVASMDGQTSHGMCAACATKMESDVREYHLAKPADEQIGQLVKV